MLHHKNNAPDCDHVGEADEDGGAAEVFGAFGERVDVVGDAFDHGFNGCIQQFHQ